MSPLQYVKHETISLRNHPEFTEKWLQLRIQEDPSILGLGDLEVLDVERGQPKAGRLDLLLRDPETKKRYEIELMLGAVDESHIIRTIEYWDIERKRYPQFEHCAVIVAEVINARFLNVISLFSSAIPMMAIQLNAISIGDNVLLNFTKVLDEVVLGEEDDAPADDVVTDRSYWESKSSKEMLALTDECVRIVQEIEPQLVATFRKYYVGLADRIRPNNFVVFRPKKKILQVEIRIVNYDQWKVRLEEIGVEVLLSGKKYGRLTFNMSKEDIKTNRELLRELFAEAYKEQQD